MKGEKVFRGWLITWAVINSISALVAFPVRKYVIESKVDKKNCLTLWKVIYFLLVLFNFSWIILGSVTLFGDQACKSDSYATYAVMMAILVLSYICIGIFFLVCCAACIFGVGFISKLRNKGQQKH